MPKYRQQADIYLAKGCALLHNLQVLLGYSLPSRRIYAVRRVSQQHSLSPRARNIESGCKRSQWLLQATCSDDILSLYCCCANRSDVQGSTCQLMANLRHAQQHIPTALQRAVHAQALLYFTAAAAAVCCLTRLLNLSCQQAALGCQDQPVTFLARPHLVALCLEALAVTPQAPSHLGQKMQASWLGPRSACMASILADRC